MPQVAGTAVFCANALGHVYHVAYMVLVYISGNLNNAIESAGLEIILLDKHLCEFNRWGQMKLYLNY